MHTHALNTHFPHHNTLYMHHLFTVYMHHIHTTKHSTRISYTTCCTKYSVYVSIHITYIFHHALYMPLQNYMYIMLPLQILHNTNFTSTPYFVPSYHTCLPCTTPVLYQQCTQTLHLHTKYITPHPTLNPIHTVHIHP